MSNSLRNQIQTGFGRFMTRYVVLSGTLILCLASAFLLYLSQRNLESQSDLVRTQLRSKISAALTQADTLINSPILWTGLMDSFSHETVVKPLFVQLNRFPDQQFTLLDYQGRVSIEAPSIGMPALEQAHKAIPELKPDGITTRLIRSETDGDLLLVLLPVMSPLSESPLGYVLTQFAVTHSVSELNIQSLMSFDFALEPAFVETGWWKLRELYTDQIQIGSHQFSYSTRYTASLMPDLLAALAFLIVLWLLGLWLLGRTQRWLDGFSRRLTTQLDQLVAYAHDIFTGKTATIEPPRYQDTEIGTVVKALETLLSEQALTQERLRKLAFEDPLTGLPIYTRFREALENRLRDYRACDNPLTLIYMDIDNLKHINDIYGHVVGDRVIQKAAKILAHHLPEPRMISRRTGDEFIAWLQVDAADVQRITGLITHFDINHQGMQIPITLTVGAASYPQDAQNTNDLVFCAEYALKQAKQRVRQSFVIFDNQLGQGLLRIKQIETRLTSAIHNCDITPYYQPEVDMMTGKLTGVEVLARWHDRELGWIAPTEFLPIVEHLRLSTALTRCVMSGVFADAARIHQRFPGTKIAMNVAPQDFHDDQLLEQVEHYAAQHPPNGASGLELELTEQDIVDLDIDMMTKLDKLIGFGARVAIDDFGTRYSSLSRLTTLPLHRLKIDGSFVANITDSKGEEVVRLIISLAKALNLDITAEGVETIAQRDRLIELGCIHAQGWLYHKAVPLTELLCLPQQLEPRPSIHA